MRILVVDDDPVILDLLADCLTEDQGYHLHMYDSAESGLEALQASDMPFDCILLDIMLPGMDGIQMCEVLRQTTQCCSMSAISETLKLRFEEPLDLKVPGMSNILAQENELLRCSANCFAMTMFTLNVSGLRGIYRTVRSPAFRQCLETIGTVAVQTLRDQKHNLSYIGNGRFFGTVMDRKRLDYDKLTTEFQENLLTAWDFTQTGVPVPPACTFSQVSPQRMWSNLSASDKLRDCINLEAGGNHLTSNEENDLFARLNNKLPQEN